MIFFLGILGVFARKNISYEFITFASLIAL
jgi:hypothetical protein